MQSIGNSTENPMLQILRPNAHGNYVAMSKKWFFSAILRRLTPKYIFLNVTWMRQVAYSILAFDSQFVSSKYNENSRSYRASKLPTNWAQKRTFVAVKNIISTTNNLLPLKLVVYDSCYMHSCFHQRTCSAKIIFSWFKWASKLPTSWALARKIEPVWEQRSQPLIEYLNERYSWASSADFHTLSRSHGSLLLIEIINFKVSAFSFGLLWPRQRKSSHFTLPTTKSYSKIQYSMFPWPNLVGACTKHT